MVLEGMTYSMREIRNLLWFNLENTPPDPIVDIVEIIEIYLKK